MEPYGSEAMAKWADPTCWQGAADAYASFLFLLALGGIVYLLVEVAKKWRS